MATVSGGTTSERFGFIQVHGRELGVRYLCQWLGVSRSGYYAWLKRPESQRAREDRDWLRRIRQVHEASRGCYGSPRVYQALRKQGHSIGRGRVERLMREAGMVGKAARMYRRIPGLEKFHARHRNLRLDVLPPEGPDEQWVGDLTYIRVGGEWNYLAVVMDVFSRRVIGWSLGEHKTAALTLRALRQAIKTRHPEPDLIFHTDRGVEYSAYRVQNELKRHGIRPSMNRPGHCTDNAHMESFFHSLKAERIHGVQFRNLRELRLALSSYITQFYNRVRLHSGIDYMSPAEYERVAA